MNLIPSFAERTITELRDVMVFFAQKSFKIYLPPAHQFAGRRETHVNQHRVERVDQRFQIVNIFARVAGRVKFDFLFQYRLGYGCAGF